MADITITNAGGTYAVSDPRGASKGSTERLGLYRYSQSVEHYRLYLDIKVTVPVHAFKVSIQPTGGAYGYNNDVHWEMTDNAALTAPPEDSAAMKTGSVTMDRTNRVEFTVTLDSGAYLLPGTTYRLWLLRTEGVANDGYWEGIPTNSPAVSAVESGGLVNVRRGNEIVACILYGKVDGALVQLIPYVKDGGVLKIGV